MSKEKPHLRIIKEENHKEAEGLLLEQNCIILYEGTKLNIVEKGKLIAKFFKISKDRTEIFCSEGKNEQKQWVLLAKISNLTHLETETEISTALKSKKLDSEKAKLSFTLYHKNGKTFYDFVASTRDDFVVWVDSLRSLMGEKMKENESLQNIESKVSLLFQLSIIELEKQTPPLPPPPLNYNFK
ncbi:engulfment and cell motility protein [Anaeramoeba flamelloides]|uniref:Engulfment and cell motility protein n=1 Tax=Anaeramoeba flamelloides TaxID=1746091 RepID=A0ABQ8XY03_9EUKA|nr:engulfment and cell motility protein [Anaeramoeba flamelloides]